MTGATVDLAKFPAPVWHRHDGGPFIGSGSIVIMRDPDGGWINASIYRVQVHGRNKVTVQFDHAGRHGAIIAKKYWDQGKPCPLAVVNGEDPALFIAGFEYLPAGQSEYEFAGAIKGAPIEVFPGTADRPADPGARRDRVRGPLLPMSETTLPEGPFGEFTGYYASEARPAPVMEVTAAYHRDDPILLGSPPMKPPRFHFGLPFRAATIWQNLDAAGVTDVVGAWQHVSQLMTVVALKQRYDGHAKRAALVAAAHSYMARMVVVVDEDVDPSNLNDVMWAVATRCEPSEQVDIMRNAWSSALDPRIPPEDKLARHHLALQADHRGLPAVPVDRQVPADLGAVIGGGARDRGEVGRGVEENELVEAEARRAASAVHPLSRLRQRCGCGARVAARACACPIPNLPRKWEGARLVAPRRSEHRRLRVTPPRWPT